MATERPCLKSHIEKGHSKVLPITSISQAYKWFKHYAKFKEVPAITRQLRPGKRSFANHSWTLESTEHLQAIVDHIQYVYLDARIKELDDEVADALKGA
jgi:hypothetical protein